MKKKSHKTVWNNGNEKTPFFTFSISRKHTKEFDRLPLDQQAKVLRFFDSAISEMNTWKQEFKDSTGLV